MKVSIALLVFCWTWLPHAVAMAQKYPSKPIRLIVPFPPAGGADIIARGIGQRMSERLGQQILIDNRAGASGLIGAEVAAKAPADGYTLVLGTSSNFSISPSLARKPPYDPVRDFVPVEESVTAPLHGQAETAIRG
jgi:tripartite-type tricarboxylate transporter receptor subunit TctC